jgi:hypothetical protein
VNSNQPTPTTIPVFQGGYTPVNLDQHCAGKMSKTDARQLCKDTGGFLCPTQAAVNALSGKKLGCSLDSEMLWSDDVPDGGSRFVRCCAQYGLVNTCDKYTSDLIKRCASYTKPNICVNSGSGISRQIKQGFGTLLTQYRNNCRNGGVCKGLVEPWFPRDDCIFCLKPGATNGDGQCRPGNDYGICQSARPEAKQLFSLLIKSTCGPETICRLTNAFPDLGSVLGVPTASPTSTPTFNPTPPTYTNTPSQPPVKCSLIRNKDRCLAQTELCLWRNQKCQLNKA